MSPARTEPALAGLVSVRKRIEERELLLSPRAAKSAYARGRDKPEEPPPLRSEFQRDRDRIIHSKAFRRLKHKTQVFIAPLGDHYVTRLNTYPPVVKAPSNSSTCSRPRVSSVISIVVSPRFTP